MTTPAERMLRSANTSPFRMLLLASTLMAAPALQLAHAAFHDALGVNPLDTLIRVPGTWALVFLLSALAIGPLRRLSLQLAVRCQCSYGKRMSDWNWLLRLRRPLGLAAFFYGAAHFGLYLWLDLGLDWDTGAHDLLAKPFLAAGVLALLLLLPLAVTSTDGWMRRLKRHWKSLHMLVFPAAALALMHVILLSKPGVQSPYAYGAVLITLLAYRLLQRRAPGLPPQDRADGTVPERSASAPRPPAAVPPAPDYPPYPITKELS